MSSPDSAWAWLVCACAFLSNLLVSGDAFTFGILLPSIMDEFDESKAKTALLGSLAFSIGFALSPLSSMSCDRFGFRFTAIVGTVVTALGLGLTSLVTVFPLMYLTYSVVTGLGYGFVYNATILVVLASFVKWRAVAVGLISSANSAGLLVVSQTNSVYLREFGWRGTIRIMSAKMVLSLLCSLTFRPVSQEHSQEAGGTMADNDSNHDSISNTQESAETIRKGEDTAKKPSRPFIELHSNGDLLSHREHIKCEDNRCSQQNQNKLRTVSLFQNRRFIIFTSSATVVCLPYFMFIVHVVKYAEQELGISRERTSSLFIYLAIAQFFGRLIACRVIDIKAINKFYFFQCSAVGVGVFFITIPLAHTSLHLTAVFIMIGFLDAVIFAPMPLLVLECVGQRSVNKAWGVFHSFIYLSSAAGPPIAGLIADLVGSYVPAFYASGTVMLLGSCIMFFVNCTTRVTNITGKATASQQTEEEMLVVEKETAL